MVTFSGGSYQELRGCWDGNENIISVRSFRNIGPSLFLFPLAWRGVLCDPGCDSPKLCRWQSCVPGRPNLAGLVCGRGPRQKQHPGPKGLGLCIVPATSPPSTDMLQKSKIRRISLINRWEQTRGEHMTWASETRQGADSQRNPKNETRIGAWHVRTLYETKTAEKKRRLKPRGGERSFRQLRDRPNSVQLVFSMLSV